MEASVDASSVEPPRNWGDAPWISVDLHRPPRNSVEAPRRAPLPVDIFAETRRRSVEETSVMARGSPWKPPWSSLQPKECT